MSLPPSYAKAATNRSDRCWAGVAPATGKRLSTAHREVGLGSICEALQTEGQHPGARSLMEGMEQTLTPHRLNVDKELRQNLRTTNIMEHLNSQINESLHRIKRWVNSDQCHRWVAMALKEAEPRLNPIQCTDQLSALQETLREQVQKHRLKSTSNRL